MKNRLLVREAHIRSGCWSHQSEPGVAPTLVCPLCVMDGNRQPDERTATYARSGHIQCLTAHGGCGRYSEVFLCAEQQEVPLFPVGFMKDPRFLATQSAAIASLRPALEGNGGLENLIALDEEKPHVTAGFVMPRIVVEGTLIVGTIGADYHTPADVIPSSQRRREIPSSVRRVLESHQASVA